MYKQFKEKQDTHSLIVSKERMILVDPSQLSWTVPDSDTESTQ